MGGGHEYPAFRFLSMRGEKKRQCAGLQFPFFSLLDEPKREPKAGDSTLPDLFNPGLRDFRGGWLAEQVKQR